MLNPNAISRLQTLLDTGKRQIVGIVGAPGAGKSTFAQQLAAHFGEQALVLPMDGFHLANGELKRLGRDQRKGAPDTFDAFGYINLLLRLCQQKQDEIIYAPYFDRALEESIAGGIAIQAQTPLIITEGNYLLLESEPWRQVHGLLDQAWYLKVNESIRMARLIKRHVQFGRTPQAAHDWVNTTDEPNARLIETSEARADWVVEN